MAEDIRQSTLAAEWGLKVRHIHTPLDLVRDIATNVPVVGPLFAGLWPRVGVPRLPDDGRDRGVIAISQGIYAGGAAQQLVTAWEREIELVRPTTPVRVIPNVHSGIVDVAFSLLNLSHGYAYDAAGRILSDLGGSRRVELLGFSGGAQRFLVAGHLLVDAGVTIDRFTGIAGPSLGPAPARDAVIFLDEGLCPDPVVASARIVGVLDFVMLRSPGRVDVLGADEHHVPYFPDYLTRAPNGGYAREIRERLREHR
jgi:hypothetical protein